MGHPRTCNCRQCTAAFESTALKGDIVAIAIVAAIAGIIWIATAPLRIWHTIGADGQEHPDTATWIAYGIGGTVIFAALVYLSLRMTAEPGGKAPVRVPVTVPEALGIAAALEAEPDPPACGHLYAREVENLLYPAEPPWAYLCPECGEQLPAESGDVMRSCCGTKPGRRHFGNCLHAARWHELNDLHRKG